MTHADPPGPFSFGGAVARGDPRVPPGSVASPQVTSAPCHPWVRLLPLRSGFSPRSSADSLPQSCSEVGGAASSGKGVERTGRAGPGPLREAVHARGAGGQSSARDHHSQRARAAPEPATQQREPLSNGTVTQGVQESKPSRHKGPVKQTPGLLRPRDWEGSLWGWQTPARRSHRTLFQCQQSCHCTWLLSAPRTPPLQPTALPQRLDGPGWSRGEDLQRLGWRVSGLAATTGPGLGKYLVIRPHFSNTGSP